MVLFPAMFDDTGGYPVLLAIPHQLMVDVLHFEGLETQREGGHQDSFIEGHLIWRDKVHVYQVGRQNISFVHQVSSMVFF